MEKSKSTDLRTVKTRRAICEALLHLLNEYNLNEITVTMLCGQAMINRKTFYRHYDSISDVLTEIENSVLKDFRQLLRLSKDEDLPDVYVFFNELNGLINRNRKLYAALMRLDGGQSLMAELGRVFGTEIADYILKKYPDTNRDSAMTAVSYIMSGLLSIYRAWFWGETHMTLEQVADIAAKLTGAVIDCYGREKF